MEYIKLVEIYEKLEKTTKRLEKTHIISEFLKKTDAENLPIITLLLQGKLFPNWDENKTGVASRLILKAINTATGINASRIEHEWKNTGDLGITAENLVGKKRQSTLFSHELSVKKVFNNLRKLAVLEGAGTVDKKMKLIAELLTSAKPMEAKYIVRTVLEELRVGVGEGSLRDAIVWAFFGDKIGLKYMSENKIEIKSREEYKRYIDAVQKAYDVTNDFSSVAASAKKEGLRGLDDSGIEVFRPLKVMLALKVKDIEEGFERCGKPADIEYKLDGFRIQAHKEGDKIRLFTRRLEDVTAQFPDVVEYVKKNIKGKSFIIDSEAAGFDPKTGKYLPFQKISQRIKRKYNINEMAKMFPVEMNVFDVLYYNGKNMIKEGFKKRRELIEKIVTSRKRKIVVVKNLISPDAKKAEEFYKESMEEGNEGVMFKKLDAPYKPGARVGFMVKLKGVQEGLDVVITAAEWGEGKRARWLSSFTIACIDKDGRFLDIGKVGTGIKEKADEGVSFEELTKLLKPLIKSEKGKTAIIRPKIVIEVTYEEIQKSPTYSSGYALRFPRFKQLRNMDKRARDIVTLDEIEDMYFGQRKSAAKK
ncbi:ATP-dependent DNA ligase [Candidatus Woesearchaeota archaeon]|nr:ATP-dependent DNA ligase [Candidatus Woesearchaeota archaeon]